MEKAIPVDYRRNYKREFVEVLKIAATCIAMVAVITFFVVINL